MWADLFGRFFARTTRAGRLAIDVIDLACSQLIALLHGQIHTRVVLDMSDSHDLDIRELHRYSQRCVDMFMAYYGR